MNEGLELLRYFGFDDETMGVVLALVARAQRDTVPAVIASLQESAAAGSNQARDVVSFYERASVALESIADAEARRNQLHAQRQAQWTKARTRAPGT